MPGDDVRSARPAAGGLLKERGLRVVLALLHAGTRLDPHHAPGPLTLQVLSGRVRLAAGRQALELGPGVLVALESALEHDVEAVEESALLLTLPTAG